MAFISIGEKPQRGERLQAGVKRSATPDNEHEQTNPDRVKETFLNRRFLFFHAFGISTKKRYIAFPVGDDLVSYRKHNVQSRAYTR